MNLWEWIGSSVLGLQAAVMVWLIKDYLAFRLSFVPRLVNEEHCLRHRGDCQRATRRDLAEIKRHLEAYQGQAKRIEINLARLCERLEVDCTT